VNSLQERVEVQSTRSGDDDFTVQDQARFEVLSQSGFDLRKLAAERRQIAALKDQGVAFS
jgi:hypothetical protein